MQRINITLDEQTYDILRAVSFQQKRSMSEIVRESSKVAKLIYVGFIHAKQK